VTRLFAGTPWDRPPTCDRCGKLESECQCPPSPTEPKRTPPESQTARIRLEKRPRGKVATVVANLDAEGTDLPLLATRLKSACGSGGTVKDGVIEIQGDHVTMVDRILREIGFRTKVG
jgi:translation initiation factor 1